MALSKLAPIRYTGHRALAALSYARERRLRSGARAFRGPTATTPLQRKALAELQEHGITRIEGLVPDAILESLRSGIREMVENVDARADRVSAMAPDGSFDPMRHRDIQFDEQTGAACYDPDFRIYTSNDPFQLRPELWKLALGDDLVRIANSYFGRQAYVARGLAVRHLPSPPRDVYQWRWHHDSWGRKLNVHILLTDIGDDGQFLAYKMGTHKLYHGYRSFRTPEIEDDEYERRYASLPTFKTTGKAGDLMLLDGNGIHRATSGETLRDAYLLMYYPDRTFSFGHAFPPEVQREFTDEQRVAAREIIRTRRIKQERGEHNILPLLGANWWKTLPHVRAWM